MKLKRKGRMTIAVIDLVVVVMGGAMLMLLGRLRVVVARIARSSSPLRRNRVEL